MVHLCALAMSLAALARPTQNIPILKRINAAVEQKADPYWRRAMEEVYHSPEELVAQDRRETRRGHVYPKLLRGNPTLPYLALTFDDGPHPAYTLKLLRILHDEGVPATFFVIGKMVEKHPELAKAIAADGHALGNHTFSHVTLTRLPYGDIVTELRANNDLVRQVTGKSMKYSRPPGGDYDSVVIAASSAVGLSTVLWTDDPGDFANPGDQVLLQRTLASLGNGGIILLHDGAPETLDVLPIVIRYAKSRGFRFVSLDQMVAGLDRPRREFLERSRKR